MILLTAALLVLAGSGMLALAFTFIPKAATAIGVAGALLGCGLGFAASIPALLSEATPSLLLPWQVPYGSFSLELDPLSSVFLLAVFGLGAVAAVFGGRYMLGFAPAKGLGAPWCFFNLLLASMALVIVARNGILFLVAWEAMAIVSFFLVTFEHEKPEVRRAGWIYLVAAHVSSASLLVFFALLGRAAGSLDFDRLVALRGLGSGLASALFMLALLGFGTKAGIMPLHVWLPEAHPAAPSHVSAIMSGVMIKTGIYGLLRGLTFIGPPQDWWAVLLILLGLTSGILGILFAMAQRDLKRLLAYSSVENIGIITLGLGVGVLGLAHGLPALALLGFAGAILHVLNHAVFKGLLFLGAGSVLHATGLREMDQLGGLMKRMPWTGTTFLIASAAIAGLPPLNGFVSEFLVFFGGLAGGLSISGMGAASLLAVTVGLAFIGGLATACFTKAFGVVFLGSPRTEIRMREVENLSFNVPLSVLAALCVVFGLGSVYAVRLVLPAAAEAAGIGQVDALATASFFLGPLSQTMVVAAVLIAIISVIAGLRLWLLAGRSVTQALTWDCGYELPTARMQYTSASFAQPLLALFRGVLQPRRRESRPSGYFPQRASFREDTPDVFIERIFSPFLAVVGWSSAKLHMFQQGRLHLYLLYIMATLAALLVWKLAWA